MLAAKSASAITSSRLTNRMVLRVAPKYTFVYDTPPPLLLSLALCVSRSCSMCSRKGLILSVASSLVPKYPPPFYPKLSIMLLNYTLSRSLLGRLQYVPRT